MSIEALDLRKLVKIVRQYEVIYGGGISTSDAAIREECELLVGLLESELGLRKPPAGRKARGEGTQPSLIDVKKRPRGEARPKLTSTRSSELAKLGTPRKGEGSAKAKEAATPTKTPKASAKAAVKQSAALAKKESRAGKEVEVKQNAKGKAKGKASAERSVAKAPAGTKRPVSAKAEDSAADEASIVIRGRSASKAAFDDDDVYKDVRSRHVSAIKASAERDAKIAGQADNDGDPETKHRFAALHLFDAFQQNKLPKYGGYIVCLRFVDDRGYAVIEIIGYENLQDIYPDGDTLIFKSVGCKLFAITEPAGYLLKSVEPVNRPNDQMIPYRFSELARITTKRFQNVFIGRKPVYMPTSFSVFKPAGEDLAVLFYDQADVYANIQDFLIMILRDRIGLPSVDSRKAAETIARGIREFRLWMDEA
jgi:hypothetical protein